jgi:hypothetical protein
VKQPGIPQAIAAYAIPPHAPPEVAAAKREFDGIAAKWANVKGSYRTPSKPWPSRRKITGGANRGIPGWSVRGTALAITFGQ